MKKFLFPLLMLLTLAACEKDAAKLAYVLTNENVKVNNLSQDYLVQVDNGARTIYIEVDYLDKAELAALQVEFVGLPDDVTANPASSTFNYAAEGASQKVELTQGKAKAEYVITAAAAISTKARMRAPPAPDVPSVARRSLRPSAAVSSRRNIEIRAPVIQ